MTHRNGRYALLSDTPSVPSNASCRQTVGDSLGTYEHVLYTCDVEGRKWRKRRRKRRRVGFSIGHTFLVYFEFGFVVEH